MPSAPLPQADRDRIAECAARGLDKTQAARETGLNRSTVHKYWPAGTPKRSHGGSPSVPPVDSFREADDGTAEQTRTTFSPVKTLEDVVRVCEIDTSVWEVVSYEVRAWTVGMNPQPGQRVEDVGGKKSLVWNESKPVQTQQYGIRVKLKRILSRALGDAMKFVFARFVDAAPRWPKFEKAPKTSAEPFMAVFGLFDVHFGKLCWANETGEHYDLKIAEAMFRNAVTDLVAETGHRNVTKVLLPLGNDWFHIDNRSHTTTRGTSQDVDGRFSKVLATGTLAAVWAVEQMAAIAPVQVELVPGNHDRTLAEALCHILAARFHHTDRVQVNHSPITRKYVRFGTNLIGLTHGDLVKPEKLPGLMPVDAKSDWAETTTHEWLTGHGHRSQKWTTMDTDTQQGTVVRQLRALTRTDLWHFDHGFVGSGPACECYFYGRDRGYAGHAVVPARM